MPTALVTGATNGIGLEIARGLAAAGWRVYVHGRDAAKAQGTCDAIRASTGNAAVFPVLADFDALDAVRAMAGQFLAGGEVLDLLVSNAAVVTLRREQTADGFERMLGVNCLAACLLVRLLLPALRRSPQGRVVIVASEAHRFVKGMRWDDLQSQQGFKAMKTYGPASWATCCSPVRWLPTNRGCACMPRTPVRSARAWARRTAGWASGCRVC